MSSYAELAEATADATRVHLQNLDAVHERLHTLKDAARRPSREDLASREANRARVQIVNGHDQAQTFALISIARSLEDLVELLDDGRLSADEVDEIVREQAFS